MLTKTQEQILVFLLSHPEEKPTIRGIAKKLGKSYTLVYNNIADLEKKNIIKKEPVPPAQIVTLNEFAPTPVFVDIELKRKKDLLQKYPWIQVMLEDIFISAKNLFFILLVFGSYAKGLQTAKSDLDLLIIVRDKKDIREIEDAMHKAYTKVKKAPNFIDTNDFREMILNPGALNIGNEARKYHVILYGVEGYYQLLNGAYKR
ncbi:MAG: nucleotidyltransferase domain-containing protein [Candidatus Woesearchaeota archaeon]|nr:nucleotidyltransferase domain-containing protein [Candidatus Woesearchaeota archaeon]